MKKQKILVYVFKWLALIFLAYLTVKENHSKIMMLLLIGFVSAILIWEGFRDFKANRNETKSLT
jgi:nitrate/TMAO reductase-like tetraheme cytochrome c subunit